MFRRVYASLHIGQTCCVVFAGFMQQCLERSLWLGGQFDYSALNKDLDLLIYIDANPDDVEKWKLESTRRDCERNGGTWTKAKEKALKRVNDMWIRPFHDKHEKPLADVGGANVVLRKDANHHIVDVDFREGAVGVSSHDLCQEVLDMISAATDSSTPHADALADVLLRSNDRSRLKHDLQAVYIPLADRLLRRLDLAPNSNAFVVGINAPPGSGKSTLVQLLILVLEACARAKGWDRKPRVAVVSSDDLYMGLEAREEAGLTTRLDPRSLDPEYLDIVSKLKNAKKNDIIEVPRFDKGLAEGKGDRLPNGSKEEGPFDLVLVEGWRVGVQPGALWVPRLSMVRAIKYRCLL